MFNNQKKITSMRDHFPLRLILVITHKCLRLYLLYIIHSTPDDIYHTTPNHNDRIHIHKEHSHKKPSQINLPKHIQSPMSSRAAHACASYPIFDAKPKTPIRTHPPHHPPTRKPFRSQPNHRTPIRLTPPPTISLDPCPRARLHCTSLAHANCTHLTKSIPAFTPTYARTSVCTMHSNSTARIRTYCVQKPHSSFTPSNSSGLTVRYRRRRCDQYVAAISHNTHTHT